MGIKDTRIVALGVNGTEFTHQQLHDAFQLVRDPKDWKAPIGATIPHENMEVVAEAIIFYTATIPTFNSISQGRVQVIADGYRMGPAGPQ